MVFQQDITVTLDNNYLRCKRQSTYSTITVITDYTHDTQLSYEKGKQYVTNIFFKQILFNMMFKKPNTEYILPPMLSAVFHNHLEYFYLPNGYVQSTDNGSGLARRTGTSVKSGKYTKVCR